MRLSGKAQKEKEIALSLAAAKLMRGAFSVKVYKLTESAPFNQIISAGCRAFLNMTHA